MKGKHFNWRIVAAIALILVIGISGYKVLSIWMDQRRSSDEYAALRKLSVTVNQKADVTGSASAGGGAFKIASAAQPIAAPAAPEKQVDFDALRAINGQTVAWIYSEGTPVDYPVVLGEDNAFYLNHTFSGRSGSAGAIFVDADNKSDFSDKNTAIYGHHMRDGSMFASLDKYRKQSYYDDHPVIYLYTPGGDYAIELFSAYVRDASLLPHRFDSSEDFLAYVDQIKALSNFRSDVTVGADDRIVTLVTCNYTYDDARFVVHGKLVPLRGSAPDGAV
jgi:sortase B